MYDEYIHFEGNSEEFHKWMENYFEAGQVDLVMRSMPILVGLLNETEKVEVVKTVKTQGEPLELLIPNTRYFINVRKTSLALLGLILDIAYTRGFATFLVQFFGNGSDQIRRLSYDEKQVLMLVNAGKIVIEPETGEYSIKDEKDSEYTSSQVKTIIDRLVDHDVLKVDGREIKIRF